MDDVLVLLVDDEPAADALRVALRAAGAQVISCRRAAPATQALDFHRPSLVLIDPECDGGRGWDVLRTAGRDARAPVIALERARGDTARRAMLASGAHECIAKPFQADEVAARVMALVRLSRPHPAHGPVFRRGDLVIDVAAHAVRVAGRPVVLTAQQFAILRALCEVDGATLARSHLLARIAGLDDLPASERAVDLHVARLRRRLGGGRERFVETVYGAGYRLAVAPQQPAADLPASPTELLDALTEPVLVVDGTLTVRFANASALRLLGKERDAVVGRRCGDVLGCRAAGGEPLEGPRCLGRAVLSNGGVLRNVGAIVRGADGDLAVELSYGKTARESGSPLLAISLRSRAPGA